MTALATLRTGVVAAPDKPGEPFVSVGMPVYNGARFLREAVQAVRDQTCQHWELIIADNASTDGTAAICEELSAADPRIRVVRNPRNLGASANFDLVLREARGRYFKWLAADDLIAPAMIERCLAALEKTPQAMVAYTDGYLIDTDGARLGPIDFHGLRIASGDSVARLRSYLHTMSVDGQAVVPLVMGVFRTDALRGMRPMPAYYGADFILMAEAVLKGRGVHVPGVTSSFRHHAGSSSWGLAPRGCDQQVFYLATSGGLWRNQWRLRRRYVELVCLAIAADLPIRGRLELAGLALKFSLARSHGKLGAYRRRLFRR